MEISVKRVLNIFANLFSNLREVDGDMPTATAQVLITIAQNPGILQGEVAKKTGIGTSAVNRHVANLCAYSSFRKRDGYGLVAATVDHNDHRAKQLNLTREGHMFVDKLVNLIHPIDLKK